MRRTILSIGLRGTLAIVSLILIATVTASGQERVLHTFGHDGDGSYPYASLIGDAAGNLYGTTSDGGIHNNGTVFELTPRQGGGWTESVLHSFGNGADGTQPDAGLIFDATGNLYGTTSGGGIHNYGTVFKLTPGQGGGWTETVLHSFGNGEDGRTPYAGLIFDAAGSLYGSTYYGGIHGAGSVFELTPTGTGDWSEKVLYSFGRGTDGQWPYASLIWGDAGNLYGTTGGGGIHGYGTVFELTPTGGGDWSEKLVQSLGRGTHGHYPQASLIRDASGNLYGTTDSGGIHDLGTVFELTPNNDGGWTQLVLHHFGHGTDGSRPDGGLTWDAAGNLYGTTSTGGVHNDGTVFELTPNGDGGWTENRLYDFDYGSGADGALPHVGLIWDAAGNLYGTTSGDNTHGPGTVFEIMACITPPSNMIAWYSFDQTGSVQNDLAKGNTATAHRTSSITGEVSKALLFNGTSSYAEAPEQSWLDIGTDDLSMDVWVKIASPADDQGIVVLFDKRDGPEQGYSFFLWSIRRIGVQLGIHGDFTNYISNTTVPADNRWHLVAITVIRNSHTGGVWYLDGAPVDTPFDPTRYQFSLLNSAAPLEIGVRESGELGGGGYFKGGLDEMQIFNRALSPAEVQAIYLAGSAGSCKQ